MRKRIRLFLAALLLLGLAVSGVMLLRQQLQYHESAESYHTAASLARLPASVVSREEQEQVDPVEPVDPIVEVLSQIDLAALQEVNPDVTGWICIPDTELSYPILYGTDNSFYLGHMWDRTRNSGGSIFFDWRCDPGFKNFNTVIYGHRMNNDSMFGTLKYYNDQNFWEEHPSIYIMDDTGVHIYDIFSAWEPSITSIVYTIDFTADEGKQEFLDTCLTNSQLDTGIVPGPSDKILTLSTCTSSGSRATRWVVQAVEQTAE